MNPADPSAPRRRTLKLRGQPDPAKLTARIAELKGEVAVLRQLARKAARPTQAGFGGTLRLLRERRGLGSRELAKKAGLSFAVVALIERNEHANPRLETIEGLAAGLGLTASQLLAVHEAGRLVKK